MVRHLKLEVCSFLSDCLAFKKVFVLLLALKMAFLMLFMAHSPAKEWHPEQ